MQKLLNDHFHREEYGKCENEACQAMIYKTKPGKPTDIAILEPAQGIVIAINRQMENPFWNTPEWRAMPKTEQEKLAVRIIEFLGN